LPRVHLFIPCVVDQFLPPIGVASRDCLSAASCEVVYDPAQTCCGQMFWNSGYPEHARDLARRFVRRFASADLVVGPSFSCVEMVRQEYADLLDDPGLRREWEALRARVFELCEFLTKMLGIRSWPGRFRARAVLHESCHMPRDPGLRDRVRNLLSSLEGLELLDPPMPECCGFGGIFFARWREVSAAIGRRRIAQLTRDAPEVLLLSEPGCILQLKTVAPPRVRVLHVAEVLAAALRAEDYPMDQGPPVEA